MSATPPSPRESVVDAPHDPEAPHGRRPDGQPIRALIANLHERRTRQKERHFVVRGLYLTAAITVVLVGIVMLVTPGPAFVLIPVGLTLLSLEFASAERLLDRALDQADAAKGKARESTPAQRALVAVAACLAIGGAITASLYWDIPYLPV